MKRLALILAIFCGPAIYGQDRYAMFSGNTWPNQEAFNKFTQFCGYDAQPIDASISPKTSKMLSDIESIAIELQRVRESWNINRKVSILPINSQQMNAWTLNFSGEAIICLPKGLPNLLSDSHTELFALIAHEMGHAIDTECFNYGQRSVRGQSSCETRADAYALAGLIAAHFNPYALAGMFGRLEMYSGDTSTGMMARLNNVISGSNHPITPDRIKNAKNLLAYYSKTGRTAGCTRPVD